MDLPTISVAGIVTKVEFKRKEQQTEFTLRDDKNRNYPVITTLFCPVRYQDVMYATLTILPQLDNRPQEYALLTQPFVQPSANADAIISSFIRGLKINYSQGTRVFNEIMRLGSEEETQSLTDGSKVVLILSSLAQRWEASRDKDLLTLIPSLELEQTRQLYAWWHKERNLRRLHLLGLNNKEINACRMTCEEIYQQCLKNPYAIPAIPIEKCQKILRSLGKSLEDKHHLCGQIVRTLWKNLYERGWSCTPTLFISREYPKVKEVYPILRDEYGLIVEYNCAYLPYPYKVECFLRDFFAERLKKEKVKYDTPFETELEIDGEKVFRQTAAFTAPLSLDQKAAVQGCLDHLVSILTGGAGTGKTTCIEQLVYNLELRGAPYLLCSFTGKAVARLRQVTGQNRAATIHRLINNAKRGIDIPSRQHEKNTNPGKVEYLIIDEASMVTSELFYELIQAYPSIQKIILVGDVNQLPPISWGALMYQLLTSGTVPVYRLLTNHRVYVAPGERDGIIVNANSLINHNADFDGDFHFYPTANFQVNEANIEYIYDIVSSFHRSGVKVEEMIVICPYTRYIPVLNSKIQALYSRPELPAYVDSRGVKWMLGDLVMHTINDPDINVFNGESGVITEVYADKIVVNFGQSGVHEFITEPTIHEINLPNPSTRQYLYQGEVVEDVKDGYDGEWTNERSVLNLVHSYAITVDKAQGSEWNFVIGWIPLYTGEKVSTFLNRNRYYSLLTRGKRAAWIVTDNREVLEDTCTRKAPYRFDNLGCRIGLEAPKVPPFTITAPKSSTDMDNPEEVPPIIEDDVFWDD